MPADGVYTILCMEVGDYGNGNHRGKNIFMRLRAPQPASFCMRHNSDDRLHAKT